MRRDGAADGGRILSALLRHRACRNQRQRDLDVGRPPCQFSTSSRSPWPGSSRLSTTPARSMQVLAEAWVAGTSPATGSKSGSAKLMGQDYSPTEIFNRATPAALRANAE